MTSFKITITRIRKYCGVPVGTSFYVLSSSPIEPSFEEVKQAFIDGFEFFPIDSIEWDCVKIDPYDL